ncbi:MAG: magnesium transporter CorA family protein [Candidatus Buchananbacteria bacterium]|nr:magnesium transporter CorA family protein [Candidatus Buchananbacteria bacterium]
MAIKTVKSQNFDWYYLTDFSNEELNFLKTNFKFHPLDLKDCAGEIRPTKIDIYRNYIFLVFQIPYLDKVGKKVSVSQVYFFLGKGFLVTITKSRMKIFNNFFYRIVNNPKVKEEAFSQDAGYLLYKILDLLLRSSWLLPNYLDQDIRRVEADIEEGHTRKIVFEIATLRRLMLQLKAIIDPQKIVTNTLSRLDAKFIDSEMLVYFDDLDDFIEKNIYILESYRDRVLSLYEINEALMSHRTNSVMKILTVMSVALMPLTLLSGIYGMNIDLPLGNHPFFIWGLFIGLAALILGVLFYLRKKDWI